MNWPAQIVAYLLELRAAGLTDFDEAWAQAELAVPPSPRLLRGDAVCPPFATFFRGACEREWKGLACTDFVALREQLEPGEGRRPRRHDDGLYGGRTSLIA